MKVVGIGFIVMLLALLVLLSLAAHAAASRMPDPDEYGLLAGAFLSFASAIVALKLIPGIIRFAAIIREEAAPPIAETASAADKSPA